MSDTITNPTDSAALGVFDADGNYQNRKVTENDLDIPFSEAIKELPDYKDGQLVSGKVVKVSRDEVLLDIGYKQEGVIPARELSIRADVNPADLVKVGDEIEAVILTLEDREDRTILSKKRAQYEKAWGRIEKIKEENGTVSGQVIEVVKCGLIVDI